MRSSVIQGLRLLHPDEFVVAHEFAGLMEPDSATSIAVTVIPGPVDKVLPGFTSQGMERHAMRWLGQESVRVAGLPARLVHAAQVQDQQQFIKWICIFGNPQQTWLITGTVPQDAAPAMQLAIRNILCSATWSSEDASADVSHTPFSLTPDPPLALARTFEGQAIYTRHGHFPVPAPTEPLLVVSPLLQHIIPSDAEAFAQQRIGQTASVRDVAVRERRPLQVAAWQGWELIADGVSDADAAPLVVYQATLHADRGGVIVQGLAGRAEEAVFLPLFARAARTLGSADSVRT